MLRRMLLSLLLSWHWSWFPLVRFQPGNAYVRSTAASLLRLSLCSWR